MGLEEAAILALCNSPKVRSAWETIRAQAAALGEAKAALLPTVAASVTWQHQRDQVPGHPEQDGSQYGHSAFLGADWRLFDFGGRTAARDSARHLLTAALSSHDAQLQATLESLVSAYFDAIKARAELTASQETQEAAINTRTSTERREQKGASSHNDTLQSQVEVAKAALSEKRAEGAYRSALAVLGSTVGLSPTHPISLPPLEDPNEEVIGELTEWLSVAEREQPALMAAREHWQAMLRTVDVVRSQQRPTVDLNVNRFENGYPNQGISASSIRQTTVGLTLSVPLFDGFSTHYKIDEAAAQARVAEAQYADSQQQVWMSVVKAHADAVSASANLSSSADLLRASQDAADSSMRRYENGVGTMLELLTSQTNFAYAQQERARCLTEWYAARLKLMTTAGSLGMTRLTRPLAATDQ